MQTITDNEIDQFDADGAVTLERTPFDAAAVAAGRAAAERMFEGNAHNGAQTNKCEEPALLDMATHPFMQDVARRLIGTSHVRYLGNAVSRRYRDDADEPFGLVGEHADGTYPWEDFIERPRRVRVTLLIWLTDVTMDRSPLMYRPGSHRVLAEAFDRTPEARPGHIGADKLPSLGLSYAPIQPLLARAGQVTAITLGVVHSASVCTGDAWRLVMFNGYAAAEHAAQPGTPQSTTKAAAADAYQTRLRQLLPPDRHHLLAEAARIST